MRAECDCGKVVFTRPFRRFRGNGWLAEMYLKQDAMRECSTCREKTPARNMYNNIARLNTKKTFNNNKMPASIIKRAGKKVKIL